MLLTWLASWLSGSSIFASLLFSFRPAVCGLWCGVWVVWPPCEGKWDKYRPSIDLDWGPRSGDCKAPSQSARKLPDCQDWEDEKNN